MEKESYSIDDILSEVKKRREEQEKALKQEDTENQPVPESDGEENEPEPEEDFEIKEKAPEEKQEDPVADTNIVSETDDVPVDNEEPEQNSAESVEEEQQENGDMIDILKIAETPDEVPFPEKEEKPAKEKFFKTKKGKIVKAVIIILVILIVAAGIAAGIFINNVLKNVADDDDDQYNVMQYYDGMDFLQEDFPVIEEQSAYDVYSYKEYLKYWYQNGDPVRSSHVLNILLIGEDTREEKISDVSRADSAILASINIDTGTIHLTSVLRDLYVYYEVDGEGHYGKINESASMGGLETYIHTLERYYKVAVDGYAVVNFASFPKIIDALGGVDINITEAEINEINNHPYTYGDVGEVYIEKTFEGSEGVMKLDGIQSLAYCRIRHIDSDGERANRQKAVLTELLNKAKSAGTIDTVKMVNQLSQYTKTSYTKKEIISIGNLALRDGWLSYQLDSVNVPKEENCKGGQNFSVSYNNWIWIADIPKDAYELQMKIYGKSNIQLNENRPDYISMGQ